MNERVMNMFKKIRRMLAFTLALVMMFSVTAFAAEDSASGDMKIVLEDVEYSYDGPVTRGPAAPVSSVKIVSSEATIDGNGNVIIPVYIVGYGHNEIAKWDGSSATYIRQEMYSGADRVVYAFKQYWNCGPAVAGTHTFTFSTTSINSPWNTVSANAQFKITN